MQDVSDAKLLGKGNFLQLLDRKTWEFVDRIGSRGVVDIIAVTDDRNLVLVEQFRPACNNAVIELPAGLVGDEFETSNEAAADAARRELEEETGYRAGHMERVAVGKAAPGHSTETVSVFLASDLVKVSSGGGVEDEAITVHEVDINNVQEWITTQLARGVDIGLRVYVGLYFAERWLGQRSHT
jgi:ADP-ribose pyrophosphatase